MHARVVSMEVLPMNMAEAVRIYRDSVVSAAKEQRGFRGALLLTDPETGEGVSISLWESEDDTCARVKPAASTIRSSTSSTPYLSARLYASIMRSASRCSAGTGL